jgi:hypothetical protein
MITLTAQLFFMELYPGKEEEETKGGNVLTELNEQPAMSTLSQQLPSIQDSEQPVLVGL